MIILHDTQGHRLTYEEQGCIAYLRYDIKAESIDAVTVYVPSPLKGRGIASQLMQELSEFASAQGLLLTATCSYADRWLQRHHSR